MTKDINKLGWKCHTRDLSRACQQKNDGFGSDIIVGTDIKGGDRHKRWGQT